MSFRLFCLFAGLGLLLILASCTSSLSESDVRRIVAEESVSEEQVRDIATEGDNNYRDATLQAVREIMDEQQPELSMAVVTQRVREIMSAEARAEASGPSLTEADVVEAVTKVLDEQLQGQLDADLQLYRDEVNSANARFEAMLNSTADRIYSDTGELVSLNNEVMLCPIEYWLTTVAVATSQLVEHVGVGQPSLAEVRELLLSGIDQEVYALLPGANCVMGADGQWKWRE